MLNLGDLEGALLEVPHLLAEVGTGLTLTTLKHNHASLIFVAELWHYLDIAIVIFINIIFSARLLHRRVEHLSTDHARLSGARHSRELVF